MFVPVSSPATVSSVGRDNNFPNIRYNHCGHHTHISDATSAYCEEQVYWKACENKTLTEVTVSELAEYIVNHTLELKLKKDYWPTDKENRTV